MRDLLSELYNKVLNFFQPAEKGEASKEIASNRLKLVLMQDRTNLDSSTLEKMRTELVDVISKYVEIDQEGLDIKITQTPSDGNNGNVPALFANIPIKDMKSKK